MKGKASTTPPWGRLGVGLLAVLIVLASLAMAGVVFGKPKLTVVTDRRGDGGGANQSPGYCDIIRATSKLAKHGRRRHTVTRSARVGATFNAPAVYITKHRVRARSDWSAGARPWPVRGQRQVFKRSTYGCLLPQATDRQGRGQALDKYFWLADQVNCKPHDDTAPNHGSVSQSLKPRHHRHHR